MGENKGETTKKQQQQQLSSSTSPSPKGPIEESTELRSLHHQQTTSAVVTGAPFIPAPLFVPIGATSSPFEQQFETVNPKRARYSSAQWKLLPSASQQQQPPTQAPMATVVSSEATPSLTTNPTQQKQPRTTAEASSSDTNSSPLRSPVPSLSAASAQETSKPEGEPHQHQFRKGKYVSPVWKPNEMLWLARAWRFQYQGGSDLTSRVEQLPETSTGQVTSGDTAIAVQSTRGKTRADKDREVAEFLNRHDVHRDAKTAGTKWDNMLGEFRKVYEWERGDKREQMGKSYFRLSPYERKAHRLPASFDEEVFEELSQFMGPKMRTQSRGPSLIGSGDDSSRGTSLAAARALPPPPPFKEDDLLLSGINAFYNNDSSAKKLQSFAVLVLVFSKRMKLYMIFGRKDKTTGFYKWR